MSLSIKLKQTATSRPKPLSVKKNAAFNFIGCLCYQGCQWLITVIVVVLSGYEDSGVLAYAMAIGNLFLPIATFNLRTFQVSDLNGEYSDGEYIGFRFVSIASAFLIIIPYSIITTEDAALLLPALIYLLFKMDESICDVLSGIHQKGERMDYIGISQFARGVLLVASFAIFLSITQNLEVAVFAVFVACAAMTVFYDLPHALRFGSIEVKISLATVRQLVKAGAPLVLASALTSLIVSHARQTFGNISGAELLGIYAAVATPSILVQAAARYFYSPLMVPIAAAWNDGKDSRRFPLVVFNGLKSITFGVGLLGILLILFGPSLLKLIYGPSIATYTGLLVGMVLATAINTFVYFLCDVLVVCRDLWTPVIASILGLLPCFLFARLFELRFGMNGINIIIIFSYTICLLILALRVLRIIRNERVQRP